MPAVNVPSPPSSAATSDPLGLSLVNGFYGPGAWSSSLIALTSSWLSVFRSGIKSSYDMLAHVFYTNWAALDLLRQTRRNNQLSFGPVAAAVVISYCGLVHCVLQFAYLGNRQSSIAALSRLWESRVPARYIYLLLLLCRSFCRYTSILIVFAWGLVQDMC
ncbi:hypothetical protein IQ06DRAFT_294489 [Phaeosphaeriaceae sp. SRC1lsM3a]|nr:hypothetical protein IQ06DRAFT_294489 [Stagonospora sp. SRC1lsM3a]